MMRNGGPFRVASKKQHVMLFLRGETAQSKRFRKERLTVRAKTLCDGGGGASKNKKLPFGSFFVLLYFFKVLCAVFAQRADEVFGKLVALVNVTAYLANIPFFAFGLGLRFYV